MVGHLPNAQLPVVDRVECCGFGYGPLETMSPCFGHPQKTYREVLSYFCGKSGVKDAENTAAFKYIVQWELYTRYSD